MSSLSLEVVDLSPATVIDGHSLGKHLLCSSSELRPGVIFAQPSKRALMHCIVKQPRPLLGQPHFAANLAGDHMAVVKHRASLVGASVPARGSVQIHIDSIETFVAWSGGYWLDRRMRPHHDTLHLYEEQINGSSDSYRPLDRRQCV